MGPCKATEARVLSEPTTVLEHVVPEFYLKGSVRDSIPWGKNELAIRKAPHISPAAHHSHLFLHAFHKYILRAYDVLGTVLSRCSLPSRGFLEF